jgi:hypothetical protein
VRQLNLGCRLFGSEFSSQHVELPKDLKLFSARRWLDLPLAELMSALDRHINEMGVELRKKIFHRNHKV